MGWVMNNLTITEVSKVTAITGIAKIRTPEGELQDLKVGDVLQPGTVVLLADASVFLFEPSMPEAGSAIAELPADQQPAMPAMGAAGGEGGQTLAQINAMQQAILSGQDPTQAFEAAAAGVAADAGGGGPGSGNDGFISIDRVGDSTIATAGYDTTAFTGADIQIPELTSSVPENAPTLVTPDVNTVSEDNPATGNVLANDSDADDVLTVGSFVVGGTTYAAGDTATLNGIGTVVINPDGSYVFTPVANWNGAVPEVTYTTNTGASSTLNIEVTAINDDPVIVDENGAPLGTDISVTTPEDTPVGGTLLATDVDNDTLTFSKGSDPTNGTVTVNSDGSWIYTPNVNYNGSDSFTAVVSDGKGGTDTITVMIGVTPEDDAPVAVEDSYTVAEDDSLTVSIPGVLGNDSLGGDGGILAVSSYTSPAHGSLTLNPDGSFTYTPVANYNGADSFSYTITDADGDTSTATVALTVTSVDDAPVAVADSYTVAEDDSLTVSIPGVLGNDSLGGDGGILAVSSYTSPAHGSLTLNPDGSFTYTPVANYNGADSFSYTITDADGDTSTATVALNVTPVADAPELVVSVIKGEEEPGIVYQAPAFNNHLNAGTTTGNIVFDGYTKTAAIDIKSYKTDVDDGRIVFLRDGVVIKEVLIDSILPDANNAPTHLVLSADEYFNTIRVENFATSADSNAEFKVDSVSLITDLTLNYTLNIVAELTDSSETLGPVMIGQAQLSLLGATLYANGEPVSDVDADGYLTVALSDTVTLKTDHYLTVEEINSITSSIASTTSDGSDFATTTTTALLDIAGTSGDDVIPGSIGDDMIHGEDGNDIITGNQGDDILTGGDGIDTFTWTADDVASGPFTDTITDFSISATDGDKLDLSAVLTGVEADLDNYLQIFSDGAGNAEISVYKNGDALSSTPPSPDMTIIIEGHGGSDAELEALKNYLETDGGLIH